MQRERFDEYIRRFNAEDPTAFDEFLAPDMRMLNGALEFTGVAGMREHYERRIWPMFRETLDVLHFAQAGDLLFVQMRTNFRARAAGESLFGPVEEGTQFDYRGLIMYELRGGRFATITVAYNSFTRTDVDGSVRELGIPH